MPVARNKSVETQETPKVSLDMLRNAEMVDETSPQNAEAPSTDSRPSMETLNNAEMVDETPEIDSSVSEEPDNKIQPEVKIVDGMPENDLIEKFKKVQNENGENSSNKKLEELSNTLTDVLLLVDSQKEKNNKLVEKNQQLASENSKLKLEIESIRNSISQGQSDLMNQKNKETELTREITSLKNDNLSLKASLSQLTEEHKKVIINAPDPAIPKPVMEQSEPTVTKRRSKWEIPSHNPYKSFSKKYRT